MSYRIIIDRGACSGFGSCIDTAPMIFAMGDDGIATAGGVNSDLDAALAAAEACPMGAITVVEDSGQEMR
jgi:ferredoxin